MPRAKTDPGTQAEKDDDQKLVPSRRQYLALKAEHPHAVLLYRLGDSYETFDEDARIRAGDLRTAPTSVLPPLQPRPGRTLQQS